MKVSRIGMLAEKAAMEALKLVLTSLPKGTETVAGVYSGCCRFAAVCVVAVTNKPEYEKLIWYKMYNLGLEYMYQETPEERDPVRDAKLLQEAEGEVKFIQQMRKDFTANKELAVVEYPARIMGFYVNIEDVSETFIYGFYRDFCKSKEPVCKS